MRRQHRAKAICAECEVAAKCLDHSLRFQEAFGVWGGLSEMERDRLLGRARRRAVCDIRSAPEA
jgi:WhiB family transcriptional regulator, redox-sensing transcriptional regulator